jgi:GNAT superfamily N-acetyltransferase
LSDADWRDLAEAEAVDKPEFGAFNPWRTRAHRLRVERGDGVWCVLRDADGTLAASAGLFECDGVARFASVLTVERFRRRGLMRALLAALIRKSRAPADRTAIVAESGSRAEALYRGLGFFPFTSPRVSLME